MKKIILLIILIIPSYYIYSQEIKPDVLPNNSLFKTGRLKEAQAVLLRNKCYIIINNYTFQKLTSNNKSGEIEILDTLTFANLDKKVIFQRCLQWITINFGSITYSDLESGKIIANGLIDLPHFAEFRDGISGTAITNINTSTAYTMILTLKDNKIKYTITNIYYNFKNYSETTDEISFPISSIYPLTGKDPAQWVRYISVLNSSIDKFYYQLKNHLVEYVTDAGNDYKF